MSKLRTFSICLTDLPADKITKAKNGKKYINLSSYDNDEQDRFGNDFGIWVSQTKEEREQKASRVYVGNGKIFKGQQQSNDDKDGLPF